MRLEVNWQFILFLFFLEMVAFALLAKKGFKMNDIPEAIYDAFGKLKTWFKRFVGGD